MRWSRAARTKRSYFSVYEWTGSGYTRIDGNWYSDCDAAIAAAASAAASLDESISNQNSRHLHVLDDSYAFVSTVHAPKVEQRVEEDLVPA